MALLQVGGKLGKILLKMGQVEKALYLLEEEHRELVEASVPDPVRIGRAKVGLCLLMAVRPCLGLRDWSAVLCVCLRLCLCLCLCLSVSVCVMRYWGGCKVDYALVQRELGLQDEARSLLSEAIPLLPEAVDRAHARLLEAQCLHDMGQFSEALAASEDAVRMHETELGPAHMASIHARAQQCSALYALGEEERARELAALNAVMENECHAALTAAAAAATHDAAHTRARMLAEAESFARAGGESMGAGEHREARIALSRAVNRLHVVADRGSAPWVTLLYECLAQRAACYLASADGGAAGGEDVVEAVEAAARDCTDASALLQDVAARSPGGLPDERVVARWDERMRTLVEEVAARRGARSQEAAAARMHAAQAPQVLPDGAAACAAGGYHPCPLTLVGQASSLRLRGFEGRRSRAERPGSRVQGPGSRA
eukprot:380896-Rhodomonas_salina.4